MVHRAVRDREHGSVTIDDAGNAVVRYALTDEVDVRTALRSLDAQIQAARRRRQGDPAVRRHAGTLACG